MYKIYFGTRFITFSSPKEDKNEDFSETIIICKNKKSFDMAFKDFQKDESILHQHFVGDKPGKLFRHFKNKFKVVKAAGGLVENKEGKILVMKRDGVWDLPKGKIEKDEKKKEAALREVEEECGISEIKIVNKIGVSYHTYENSKSWVLKVTYWYKMKYAGTEVPIPQTEEGISEIIWTNEAELNEIIEIAYPNLRHILEYRD